MITYFKIDVVSICEGEIVAAIMDGFIVAIVILARAWLIRSILLSTLSYVLHFIVMPVPYDGLVSSAYIFQSVFSPGAQK